MSSHGGSDPAVLGNDGIGLRMIIVARYRFS